jgi:D-glycero-D-manno-heptose 1,7-bisphosphate phosphatase
LARDPVSGAIFLDRDGVLNEKAPDGEYIASWCEFRFLPGVQEALSTLSRTGARLIVVTNQRGIALGRVNPEDASEIHELMGAEMARWGVVLSGVYVCPHDIDTCDCRKPQSGLLLRARRDFPDISLGRSAIVGDSVSDLEAGVRVGCRAFLVVTDDKRDAILAETTARGIHLAGVGPSLRALVDRGLAEMFAS